MIRALLLAICAQLAASGNGKSREIRRVHGLRSEMRYFAALIVKLVAKKSRHADRHPAERRNRQSTDPAPISRK